MTILDSTADQRDKTSFTISQVAEVLSTEGLSKKEKWKIIYCNLVMFNTWNKIYIKKNNDKPR